MPRIPVVGARDLNVAQLSPEVRRILRRRSNQAARREYAAVLAAGRAQFGVANRAYRTEAQSVRGATDMAQDSLADALRGLKSSGLRGRYLRQARQELTARQGDVAGSVPLLLADAASDRASAISDARMQLLTDRAAMHKSAASKFNSSLDSERDAASSILKSRAESRGDSELKSDPRALKIAMMATASGYKSLLDDSGKEGEDGSILTPPRSDAEWRAFALQIAKSVEGADPVDVANAVRKLRKRINAQAGKGNVRPFGIRFNASDRPGLAISD